MSAESRHEPCTNCDDRKCMGCVLREYDHSCRDDCPMCCAVSAPVFPFTDAQVGEVADALYDFDGPSHAGRNAEREVRVEQATAALTALARVLRVERGPEPVIPPPPPFVGNGDTKMQDSAKARVMMVATEHDTRGEQVDVTDAWDAMLAEIERLRGALHDIAGMDDHDALAKARRCAREAPEEGP